MASPGYSPKGANRFGPGKSPGAGTSRPAVKSKSHTPGTSPVNVMAKGSKGSVTTGSKTRSQTAPPRYMRQMPDRGMPAQGLYGKSKPAQAAAGY